jgi:hypothetical protein
MRAKTFRKRTMTTAEDTIERARPFVLALVQREERNSGSRMAAYERVASLVGVNSSWLRKLLGRQPGIVLAAHELINIASAYRSLCERIEVEAERERRLAAALREKADALLESDLGMVASTDGTTSDGASSRLGTET